ncbi:MAG TPA: DinB family protein [Pyrinomonadaceae bacterium]|nr:DinB family protein [Pyrinomonadaceae bacterium]
MSAETVIALWKTARSGFITEVERIPEDKFTFKPTPQTRTVAELVQHVIGAQKFFVGEACRPDTNLARRPFSEHVKAYGEGVDDVVDKAQLIELMRTSMDDGEKLIRSHADGLNEMMTGLDGKPLPKIGFLLFGMSHEMYHRGQFTVYERLLNVEPALTEMFRKMTAGAN